MSEVDNKVSEVVSQLMSLSPGREVKFVVGGSLNGTETAIVTYLHDNKYRVETRWAGFPSSYLFVNGLLPTMLYLKTRFEIAGEIERRTSQV